MTFCGMSFQLLFVGLTEWCLLGGSAKQNENKLIKQMLKNAFFIPSCCFKRKYFFFISGMSWSPTTKFCK